MSAAGIPDGVEHAFPLARLTTIRTGGDARYFARPGGNSAVVELLAWAVAGEIPVGVVGSGSNLLISDSGFDGLVLKLDGHLKDIAFEDNLVLCGGGARLPRVSARSAEAGLAGLEFGVNIPGTVGGAIRMNANAYGGELGAVLQWAEVASADGVERRAVDEFAFAYRKSNVSLGQVVTRASFQLQRSSADVVTANLAALRERRLAAQPSGIKTFGSTFKNPDDPRAEQQTAGQLLERAGCKGLSVGGARFSPKHANFVENHSAATTSEVVQLIVEGRARVEELCGVRLETEVQVLGEVDDSLWRAAA